MTVFAFLGKGLYSLEWLCLCDCGKCTIGTTQVLQRGAKVSCGCRNVERATSMKWKHGLHGTPEYVIWQGMLNRCRNPKNISFKAYGARGISVCERWKDFSFFYADMGPRPSSSHSIERKKMAIGYQPDNCVWATRIEQQNNTTTNRLITIGDRSMTARQWSIETGISKDTVYQRYWRGHSEQDILTPGKLKYGSNRKAKV